MIWLLYIVVIVFIIATIANTFIQVETYTFADERIREDLNLLVVSDLHSERFGRNNGKLIRKINELNCDAVVMPGDIFELKKDMTPSFELLEGLDKPFFYTTGNHECNCDIEDFAKRVIERYGGTSLHGNMVEFRGINICGIDDRRSKNTIQAQEEQKIIDMKKDGYTILLYHHPEMIGFFKKSGVDLVVCGHAHGGQWRIPFIHRGIFAPSQGFFPKYTEGVHDLGKTKLFIGRGLSRKPFIVPRLFNRPQLAIIQLRQK